MQKFKKADRERFMSDWLKCLPAMRVEKSMSLAKRNGPVLTGLYLQEPTGNTHYFVIPYIHNLSRPTNFVTLTLGYPLKNQRNTYKQDFTVKSHDREFPDACKRLHKQSLFPLTQDLSLSQIIAAYEAYIDKELGIGSPKFLYQDIISLFVWCGDSTEATKRLAKYIEIMSAWEERIFERDGGRDVFFDRLYQIIEMPNKLEEICEQQIELLKLKKIPDYELNCL